MQEDEERRRSMIDEKGEHFEEEYEVELPLPLKLTYEKHLSRQRRS